MTMTATRYHDDSSNENVKTNGVFYGIAKFTANSRSHRLQKTKFYQVMSLSWFVAVIVEPRSPPLWLAVTDEVISIDCPLTVEFELDLLSNSYTITLTVTTC